LTWAQGGYGIADAASHNGVYLNGEQVHERRTLGNGDVIQLGSFELIYVDGELPKRFAKLDPTSLERWYAVGATTSSFTTRQISTGQMKRLLSARRLMEGAMLTVVGGRVIALEDTEWGIGRDADIPLSGWFMAALEARIVWNGQNHVLQRHGRWRAIQINGLSIRSATLENGDTITIGRNTLSYEVQT
jgi:pSer/pThr/pTyr-binding forkhead associated (FHA) protein